MRRSQALAAAIVVMTAVVAGAQMPVDDDLSAGTSYADIAVNAGADFVVAWSHLGGERFIRRFDAAGGPVSGPIALENTFARMGLDDLGRLATVSQESAPDGHAIVLRRFDAAGNPLGAAFRVNTTPEATEPSVAVAPDGSLVVAWVRGTDGIGAQRFDATGAPLGGEIDVSATGSSPDVAIDDTGGFVVVWKGEVLVPDYGARVFGRRYEAGGVAQDPFLIQADAFAKLTRPRIAMAGDGSFIVSWARWFSEDISARFYDALAVPRGPAVAVSGAPTTLDHAPAMDDVGRAVVVWTGIDNDVRAQRYAATGIAEGPEITVNTTRSIEAHRRPAVGIVPDSGDFVVAWTRGLDAKSTQLGPFAYENVVVRRYLASGRALGPSTIESRKLLLREPGDPAKKRLVFKSTSRFVHTAGPEAIDPMADGLQVQIYNSAGTGESICLDLSNNGSAGWVAGGNPAAPRFTYVDPLGVNGPCRKMVIRDGRKIALVCKGSGIAYTTDEGSQGSMTVRITSGTADFCTDFADHRWKQSVKKDVPGAFVATSPQVLGCPAAPVACP